MGFSLGAIGALGTVASISVVVAKITVFQQTHRSQVDQAIRHVGTIVRILRWLSSHCPITYEKLGAAVGPATWSLLLSAGRGASAADIIFIIGRFLADYGQAIQQATPVLQALSDAFRLEAVPQIRQASP